MAEMGTMLAHVDGGVPNIRIELPELERVLPGSAALLLREGLRHERLYARASIRSISPAWKPTRRICSRCSASLATRSRAKSCASGCSLGDADCLVRRMTRMGGCRIGSGILSYILTARPD